MPPPEGREGRLDSLCDALLDGFHVAAQPLTILTMSLSAECMSFLSDADVRDLARDAGRETARLARVIRILKHLIQAYRIPLKRERFALGGALKEYFGGDTGGERTGAAVRIEAPDDLPEVWADGEGTIEMLGAVTDTMRSNAPDGAEVSIAAKSEDGQVQVLLETRGPDQPKVPSECRIAVELARVWMECEQGTMGWKASPLSIELGFKAVEVGMRGAL
jgi:hypothetical protein